MSKLTCGIVRDLLPLTVDGIADPESKTAVSEHLAECAACRRLHTHMQRTDSLPPAPVDTDFIRVCRRLENGFRLRNVFGGVLALILLFGAVCGGAAFWRYKTEVDSVPCGIDAIICQTYRDELNCIHFQISPVENGRLPRVDGRTSLYEDEILYIQPTHAAWGFDGDAWTSDLCADELAWEDGAVCLIEAEPVLEPDPTTHRYTTTYTVVKRTPVREIRIGTPDDFKTIYRAGDEIPAAEYPNDLGHNG